MARRNVNINGVLFEYDGPIGKLKPCKAGCIMNVNGIDFEVEKSLNDVMEKAYSLPGCMYTYYDIFEAYERPSSAKVSIFNEWRDFVQQVDGYGLKIVSRNKFMFTLCFNFEQDGHKFFAYITPSHNYVQVL